MIESFKGACVAVTGAAGTVGKELVKQLLDEPTAEVRALDNNETGLFELEHEVRSLSHQMYRRPLVNRNPAVNFFTYRKGKETFTPA